MKIKNFLFISLGLVMTFLSSCSDDPEPEIPNEEELITTLTYTLTPVGGGTTVELKFKDLDGDGGDDPEITGGTLAANTTYEGSIELLNELESPAEDITEEVEEENDEHQFFYQTTVNGLSVAYDDIDGDGNPVGLATKVATTTAGSGKLTVTLRHEPNKTADGVKDGDITNAGGETDIEVTFDVEVK
ncbi:hypothetical protein R9C00_08575 [Flammeovirgaceae bacterium SG7u.111]|nr:hypothetical protein [Flammeovirgaceae bacterium SG7u.132]WPO37501.1 hypothetical protein R9C00_08575 [Flammeovirgaceae bacterium SG7u.111]